MLAGPSLSQTTASFDVNISYKVGFHNISVLPEDDLDPDQDSSPLGDWALF